MDVNKPIKYMTKGERKRLLALAKVGLDAVIDEVTGYQEERFKDKKALRKRYKKYRKEGK